MKRFRKTILLSFLFGFLISLIMFPNTSFNSNVGTDTTDFSDDNSNPHQKISRHWNNFTFIHIQDGNWSDGVDWGWIQGDGSSSNPFTIENMTIDASSSPTGSGILIERSKNDYFIIKNCTVYNADNDDLDDEAGISLIETCNGTLIQNNCSSNNKGFFLLECENCTVSNNIATYNGDEGLVIAECSDTKAIGNNLSLNSEAGLDLDFSTECIIKYNNITNNGADGIEWETELEDDDEEDFYNTLIFENEISGNGGEGIRISMGDIAYTNITLNFKWNSIIGNAISDNENNGIIINALTEFNSKVFYSNNTFSNNTFSNNGDNAIYVSLLADNTGEIHFSRNNITENIIVESGSNGIHFNGFSKEQGNALFHNNKILSNNFSRNGENGLYVTLDTDNDPSEPLSKSIFNDNYISNNIFNQTGTNGININPTMVNYGNTNCNNNSITTNNLVESSLYGIYLYECTNSTVSSNNMTSCGLGIFYHQESSKTLNQITSNNIDITNLVNDRQVHYYINEVNLGENNFSNPGQVILINCNDSAIANLDLPGGSIGIILNRCKNNTITRNNATENNLYGIYLDVSKNNILSENNASNNNLAGIYLYYSNDNNSVLRNKANHNKNHGIALYYSNFNTISNNNATSNGIDGIFLFNSNYNNITGNTLMFNLIYGIYLETCNNTLISRNTINENLDIGIYLSNSHNNTISDNTDSINNNFNQGIYLEDSNFNTISRNSIRYNNLGLYFINSNNNTVTNNDLRGNGYWYLQTITCEGNVFINNLLVDPPSEGGGGGGTTTTVEGIPFETLLLIILILASIAAVAGIIGYRKYSKNLKEKEKEIEILKVEKSKLTQEDIVVAKENLLCVVHKGPIQGFTFVCPECGTFYCNRCYEAVEKLENACWSCGSALDASKPIKALLKKGKIEIKGEKDIGATSSLDHKHKKAPKDFKAKEK